MTRNHGSWTRTILLSIAVSASAVAGEAASRPSLAQTCDVEVRCDPPPPPACGPYLTCARPPLPAVLDAAAEMPGPTPSRVPTIRTCDRADVVIDCVTCLGAGIATTACAAPPASVGCVILTAAACTKCLLSIWGCSREPSSAAVSTGVSSRPGLFDRSGLGQMPTGRVVTPALPGAATAPFRPGPLTVPPAQRSPFPPGRFVPKTRLPRRALAHSRSFKARGRSRLAIRGRAGTRLPLREANRAASRLVVMIAATCVVVASASAQPAPQAAPTTVSVEEFRIRPVVIDTVSGFGTARPRHIVVRAGEWGAKVGHVALKPGRTVPARTLIMALDGRPARRMAEDAQLCLKLLRDVETPTRKELQAAHLPTVTRSSGPGGLGLTVGKGAIGFNLNASGSSQRVDDPLRAAVHETQVQERLGQNEMDALRCRRMAEDAERDLSGLNIHAEAPGWVERLPVAAGDNVEAGGHLLTYADPSSMEMLVALSHGAYQRVKEGAGCAVRWHSDQERNSRCRVSRKTGPDDDDPTAFWIAAQLFEPPSSPFSHMTGTVTIEVTATMGVVARDAIVTDSDSTAGGVYVVTSDNKVEFRGVQTGRVAGDYVELVGADLLQGDRVVRGPIVGSLQDGALVDPAPWIPSATGRRSDLGTMQILASSMRVRGWGAERVDATFVPSTAPLASWPGVAATAHDVVTGITLSPEVIQGPLAEEVAELDNLRFLVGAPAPEQPLPVLPVPRAITRLRLDRLDLPPPLCVPEDDDGINAWVLTIPGARVQTCLPLDPPRPALNEPEGRERRAPFRLTHANGHARTFIPVARGWRLVDAGITLETRTPRAGPPGLELSPAGVTVEFYAHGSWRRKSRQKWGNWRNGDAPPGSQYRMEEITGYVTLVEEKQDASAGRVVAARTRNRPYPHEPGRSR